MVTYVGTKVPLTESVWGTKLNMTRTERRETGRMEIDLFKFFTTHYGAELRRFLGKKLWF